MTFDPAADAARRQQQMVQDQHRKWADDVHRGRFHPGGLKSGGPLGFLIVVGLIALAAFWIANQQ